MATHKEKMEEKWRRLSGESPTQEINSNAQSEYKGETHQQKMEAKWNRLRQENTTLEDWYSQIYTYATDVDGYFADGGRGKDDVYTGLNSRRTSLREQGEYFKKKYSGDENAMFLIDSTMGLIDSIEDGENTKLAGYRHQDLGLELREWQARMRSGTYLTEDDIQNYSNTVQEYIATGNKLYTPETNTTYVMDQWREMEAQWAGSVRTLDSMYKDESGERIPEDTWYDQQRAVKQRKYLQDVDLDQLEYELFAASTAAKRWWEEHPDAKWDEMGHAKELLDARDYAYGQLVQAKRIKQEDAIRYDTNFDKYVEDAAGVYDTYTGIIPGANNMAASMGANSTAAATLLLYDKANNTYEEQQWASDALSKLMNLGTSAKYVNEREEETVKYYLGKAALLYRNGAEEDAQKLIDDASEYIDYMTELAKQRHAQANSDEIADLPVVIEEAAAFGTGLKAGIENWWDGVNAWFGGNSDPSVTQLTASYMAQAENISDVGNWLAKSGQVVGNMLPTVALSYMTGGSTLAAGLSVGISSGGNAYSQALKEGYAPGQAALYGSLVGASEALIGKLIGGLSIQGGDAAKAMLVKAEAIDKSFLRVAAKYGIKIGFELAEEELQNYIEPVLAGVILGDSVDLPSIDIAIETAILTLITTGMMETPDVISSERARSNYYKENYGDIQGELVDTAVNLPDGSRAKNLGTKYQTKIADGKDLSGNKLAALVNAIDKQYNAENLQKVQSAVEDRLTELGETGDVKAVAAALTKNLAGKRLSNADHDVIDSSKYGQRVANEMDTENVIKGTHSSNWIRSVDTKRINVAEMRRNAAAKNQDTQENVSYPETAEVGNVSQEPVKAQSRSIQLDDDTLIKSSGEEVNSLVIEKIDGKNVTVTVNGNKTVSANDVSFGSDQMHEAVRRVTGAVGMTPAGANMILSNPKSSNAGYISQALDAYEGGFNNQDIAIVAEAFDYRLISSAEARALYNQGVADAKAKTEAAEAKVFDVYKRAKGVMEQKGKQRHVGKLRIGKGIDVDGFNEQQTESAIAAAEIAPSLSLDIVLYEDSSPNRFGFYKASEDAIYINVNARWGGNSMMTFTLAHELVHRAKVGSYRKYKAFQDFLIREYSKAGMSLNEMIAEQMAADKSLTREDALEEVICDAAQRMLTDTNAGKKLAAWGQRSAENRNFLKDLAKWITEMFDNLRNLFKNAVNDSESARAFRKLDKNVQRILADMFVDMSVDSAEKLGTIKAAGMLDKINTTGGDVKNSLSSMANTFFGNENMSAVEFENSDYKQTEGYKNYVEQCLNNYKQSRGTAFDEAAARKSIEDSIDGIVQVALAAKRAGYDITDDGQRRDIKDSKNRLLFSSLEPNSDYFTSNDISTICDKRKNFADIYDDIVKAEEAKGVPAGKRFFDNVDNYFYIHQVMAEKGLTQPCRQCYVESMRKNLAPMATAFLDMVQETDPDNLKNKQLWQKAKKTDEIYVVGADGKRYTKKISNTELRNKVMNALAEHPEYNLTVDDLTVEMLTTEDGLAQLKIQAPLIYEYFNSFYGQAKPKMPKSPTPFRFGELTALLTDDKGRINERLIKKINSTGGFRLQSYSDFQIQNYTDVLQVLFEAGTLGLNGHAYTKVPAFLDATEGTNLKRNISIFMYKDGNEWKLDRNDSFPYTLEEIYDIVNADESGNTSIIAVSQNDDMSAWIMANDYVGYGIPFHKSGLKMGTVRDTVVTTEDGRKVKGYSGTKDHTKQQSEVYADTKTKVKNGIDIYEFWDFENKGNLSKNDLIKKNLKRYIDECEKAGYLPKFRDYVMNNGKVLNSVLAYSKELGFAPQDATIDDISFAYKGYRIPYGYYKFLGDFGMFTPDGKAAPQQTLSLDNYDFDKAVRFFEDSEDLRRTEILQQIANGAERERYRSSNLTAEQIQNIVKQKRQEVVSEVVGGNSYIRNKISVADDAEYMDAVKRGDTETQNRMVYEAAKKSGFPVKVLHGTKWFGFTKPNVKKSDDGISFFATDDMVIASSYTGMTGMDERRISDKTQRLKKEDIPKIWDQIKRIAAEFLNEYTNTLGYKSRASHHVAYSTNIDASEVTTDSKLTAYATEAATSFYYLHHDTVNYKPGIDDNHGAIPEETKQKLGKLTEKYERMLNELMSPHIDAGVYGLYANTDNHLVIDAHGGWWDNIKSDVLPPSDVSWTTREVGEYAKEKGYDGVTFKNLIDPASPAAAKVATVYIFFNPQKQLRSADPVTYDKLGRVIPLSRRFNTRKNDFRYKLAVGPDTSPEALLANASEEDATPGQRHNLKLYRDQLQIVNQFKDKVTEAENNLAEAKKAGKSGKDLQDLRLEVSKEKNRLNIHEERLEKIIQSKPIQELLDREREAAEIKHREDVKRVLAEMQNEYGTIPAGEKAVRDDSLPVSTDGNNKVSRAARTVKGAAVTTDEFAEEIDKQVANGKLTYITISNEKAAAEANTWLEDLGWEIAMDRWIKDVDKGKTGAKMAARGAVLLNNAAQAGDKKTWLNILYEYQKLATNTAQGLQAMRILKQLEPSDKLYMVQRSINQMVNDMRLGKKITLDEDLVKQYKEVKTEEEQDEIMDEIIQDVAHQLPAGLIEKFNALRYLNMLGNFRTQIRNIGGNSVMKVTGKVKEAVAVGIQDLVALSYKVRGKEYQKSRVLVANRALLKQCKDYYNKVSALLLDGARYSDTTAQSAEFAKKVAEARRVFKFKPLEWYRKRTNWATESGDLLFGKAAFSRSMAGFLRARGVKDINNASQELIDEATAFAVAEAQEQTFRDVNWLSGWVSKIGRRSDSSDLGHILGEGIMPFRKTPANILVRAVEYSPLGILTSGWNSFKALKDKSITADDLINSWAKAFTGTGLFGLGMILNAMGCLSGAADDDDDRERMERLYGKQNFAINLPGGFSFTIDWMSPSAIPMLMGAEFMEEINDGGFQLKDLESAFTSITEPLVEMSMLQGVNTALDNIKYSENKLMQMAITLGLNYFTQGLGNSFLGQLERTFQDSSETTYVDKDSAVPGWLQQTFSTLSGKIPGWDYNQIPYINAWGEEEESGSFVENVLSPSYFDKFEPDAVYDELMRLDEAQDDKNVIPSTPKKTYTDPNTHEERYLSADEYVELAKAQGKTQHNLVEKVISNSTYKKMSDVDKATTISLVYKYAREKAQMDVLGRKEFSDNWMNEIGNINPVHAIVAHVQISQVKSGKYGNTVSGSKKEKVIDIIEALPLSNSQKRTIYLAHGYSEKDCPWKK